MNRIKRRKVLVNSRFQLKFAFGFIIAALIGSISSTALFNYLATIRLEQLQWSVHISAQSTGEELQQIFWYVNIGSLVFVSILFGITGFLMLRKMNSPIFQLIKNIESIKNGDLSKTIILRQKDEFTNVAKNLDDMKGQIKRRFAGSKREYGEISYAIQEMEKEVIKGGHIEKKVEEILYLVQKLRKNPNYYTESI